MNFTAFALSSVRVDGVRYPLTAGERRFAGLKASLHTACLPDAIDFTCSLVNETAENAPLITEFAGLDLTLPCPAETPAVFNGLTGDNCGPSCFLPLQQKVTPEAPVHLEPAGGRSSDTAAFPFFDLTLGETTLVFGLGWSGHWYCHIARTPEGLRIAAGQKDCAFRLYPGEAARSLRVLIYSAPGGADENRLGFRETLRRLHAEKCAVGPDFHPPVAVQIFDRYYWESSPFCTPAFRTEPVQLEMIRKAGLTAGFDTFWIDAMWFKKAFPEGVGNWSFEAGFAGGLKAISDCCHENGLKFMLWFEPERIDRASETAAAHPEFLLDKPDPDRNLLFNLGDPAAREWLSEKTIAFMKENGVDIFRTDFNFDPLPYWQAADAPDRRGITEMRYVEGLYRFWDSLRAAFPGLTIDNCASGGRRLDLETLTRSVSCWRSDTGCVHENEHHRATCWAQNQGVMLNRYIPYHQTSVWEPVAYDMRSSMSESTAAAFHMMAPDYDPAPHAATLAEVLKYRSWRREMCIPLTPVTTAEDVWFAYTLTRKGEGCAFAFRRGFCPRKKFLLKLPDIDTRCAYECALSDEQRRISTFRLSGAALAEGITLTADGPRQSFVMEYRKL